jgi:hypothetical protein
MFQILALQALVIICGTSAFVASLKFVLRYLELRASRPAPTDVALLARLDSIERIVETTAIEVERVAEANRFMARLLADRTGPGEPARRPERVITPH